MYQGVAQWVAYLWALMDEVWGHLFDLTTGSIEWQEVNDQWYLVSMNLPEMSEKGKDIVGSVMTLVHNGLIFLAQVSTLLPAEALTPS